MTAIETEREIRHCKRRIVILEELVVRLVQDEAKFKQAVAEATGVPVFVAGKTGVKDA